jgi:hypothetical protein
MIFLAQIAIAAVLLIVLIVFIWLVRRDTRRGRGGILGSGRRAVREIFEP